MGKVSAAQQGHLQTAFLTGERGIGKTSLAYFVRVLAETRHSMVGVHTFLGGVSSLEEMARRVFDRLVKDSLNRPWHERLKELLGAHVRQVGLFGITVGFDASREDLSRIVHDFAPVLRGLLKQVSDQNSAILLILDDINGIARSAAFANWLKSLTDEIATSRDPLPACILLVGLGECRTELVAAQPSLARVFDIIEITPWSLDEAREFFTNAFASVGVRVEDDALDTLAQYCGGLPVLAHEIGDAAFNIDDDGTIAPEDASRAVLEAADVVGRKHLEPQLFQAITSRRYRSILTKLARSPIQLEFQRQEALRRLSAEEAKVFDNFLQRMRSLGAIVKLPERGAYRFTNRLHYLYFWMTADRARGHTR